MTRDAVKTLFHPFATLALTPPAEGERVLFLGAETGYDLNPLGSIGRGATFGSSHRTDEDEPANNDQEVTA